MSWSCGDAKHSYQTCHAKNKKPSQGSSAWLSYEESPSTLHDAPSFPKSDVGLVVNSSSSRPSRSINELLVIEIFSGSCNLSTAFVKRGFQALAIDHVQSHKFHTLIFWSYPSSWSTTSFGYYTHSKTLFGMACTSMWHRLPCTQHTSAE
jgi:hypothetical protein